MNQCNASELATISKSGREFVKEVYKIDCEWSRSAREVLNDGAIAFWRVIFTGSSSATAGRKHVIGAFFLTFLTRQTARLEFLLPLVVI